MKQTIMWLGLALLFATGVTLSITANSYGPSATAGTTGSATLVQPPQPVLAETPRPAVIETPRPVVAADAKPAEPEVPVAMLDDAPPRSSIRSDALARWYVESQRINGNTRSRGAGRARAARYSNDRGHCRPTAARLQSGYQAAGR